MNKIDKNMTYDFPIYIPLSSITNITDKDLTAYVASIAPEGRMRTVTLPDDPTPRQWGCSLREDVMIGYVEFPTLEARDAFALEWIRDGLSNCPPSKIEPPNEMIEAKLDEIDAKINELIADFDRLMRDE